jgi:hypothetical protein
MQLKSQLFSCASAILVKRTECLCLEVQEDPPRDATVCCYMLFIASSLLLDTVAATAIQL